MMNQHACAISIFMPVYNGSKYLHKSIKSVLNQSFKNFELVCVDDTSTDNSYDIIKDFAAKDSRIKVFQKPNGGMVPKSWNFVIPYLRGESITYMSQDDLISEDYLLHMYNRQQETGADCVLPDMVFYYEGKPDNKSIIGVNGDRNCILTNREAVELSLNWQIHGFGLRNSKILKNEYFDEDSFNSDEFMTRKLFFKSNKVVFSHGTFYYRQDNNQAITKTFGVKNYFQLKTTFRLYKFLEENNFEEKVVSSLYFAVYRSIFKLYRISSLRKGVSSKGEFLQIRIMLKETYNQLDKRKFINYALYKKGIKRLVIIISFFFFYNFYLFKSFMFLIYLSDKSKEELRVLYGRLLYLISTSIKVSYSL